MEGAKDMNHILKKYDKKKHFYSEPFPHIIIENCLDDYIYDELSAKFPSIQNFAPKDKSENEAYWISGNDLLKESDIWKEFIDIHTSQEFFHDAAQLISPYMKDLDQDYLINMGRDLKDCSFRLAEAGRENNPKNKTTDIVISIAAGINTPCKKKSIIEPPHRDYPQKIFNSLLYMRDLDDDTDGGDLALFESSNDLIFTAHRESVNWVNERYIKKIKTIKYERNLFVLFPQRFNAIHGVTERGPTIHTRKYININMEAYKLKRGVFFETPRPWYAKIKFLLIKVTPRFIKALVKFFLGGK
jgi:hypothetical protein